MKYSKRDRELAAERCQVIADHWIRSGARPEAYSEFTDNWNACHLCALAYDEADDALDWCPEALLSLQIATRWAEAEALIRTGWCPP